MKAFFVVDQVANTDDYVLVAPDAMTEWNVVDFLRFLAVPAPAADEEGYLVEPADPIKHERLRLLVAKPEACLNRPVMFAQDGRVLGPRDVISLDRPLALLRQPVGPPDGSALDLATRFRTLYQVFAPAFHEVFDALFDFDAHPIATAEGERLNSFADMFGRFYELDGVNQLRFVYRVLQIIHQAPFENVSKFLLGTRFRNGFEMWFNMAAGFGGVCAEKTAALKCVCDILTIPTRTVIAARSPFPDSYEEQLKAYVAQGGVGEPPTWAQHHMLEILLGNKFFLCDVTNGNIPLLFLEEAEAQRYFSAGYHARMVFQTDKLFLQRVSNWVGDALLTISEFQMPRIHADYVFSDRLGLAILPEVYLTAYFDWGGETTARMQTFYAHQGRAQAAPMPWFSRADGGRDLSHWPFGAYLDAVTKSMYRQCDPHYTGHITLVCQPLPNNYWRRANISERICRELASRN